MASVKKGFIQRSSTQRRAAKIVALAQGLQDAVNEENLKRAASSANKLFDAVNDFHDEVIDAEYVSRSNDSFGS